MEKVTKQAFRRITQSVPVFVHSVLPKDHFSDYIANMTAF